MFLLVAAVFDMDQKISSNTSVILVHGFRCYGGDYVSLSHLHMFHRQEGERCRIFCIDICTTRSANQEGSPPVVRFYLSEECYSPTFAASSFDTYRHLLLDRKKQVPN